MLKSFSTRSRFFVTFNNNVLFLFHCTVIFSFHLSIYDAMQINIIIIRLFHLKPHCLKFMRHRSFVPVSIENYPGYVHRCPLRSFQKLIFTSSIFLRWYENIYTLYKYVLYIVQICIRKKQMWYMWYFSNLVIWLKILPSKVFKHVVRGRSRGPCQFRGTKVATAWQVMK